MSLPQEIKSFIVASPSCGTQREVADEESLLLAGIIDSVSMVELIAHLETAYGITILEDELIPENFDTIGCIVRFVEQKRATS